MSDADKYNSENVASARKEGSAHKGLESDAIRDQALQQLWAILHESNQMEPGIETTLKQHLLPLHQIIPGASHVQKTPKDQKPRFLCRDTGKVQDLQSELRDVDPGVRNVFSSTLKEAVEGKTLVDLGAGSGSWGGYETIAIPYGAANYVAIEPSHYEQLARSIGGELEENPIGLHISPNDMRDVLRALPSNAKDLTFLMSGIDWYILNGLSENEQEHQKAYQYLKDVKNEIKRILPSGGKIITYASSVGNDGDNMEGYALVGKIKCHEGPACVWKKT